MAPKISPALPAFLRKKGPESSCAKVSLSHPPPPAPEQGGPHSLLRCSSFCRNFLSLSEGMAKEMPDVTFMVFTPITSPSCRERALGYPAWITVKSRGATAPAWGLACAPTLPQAAVPALLRLGRIQGLSLQDESMQPLALPCQHQPDLISTRAPSAAAASDTAQGSHARLSPPPSRKHSSTHKHSHKEASSKRHTSLPQPARATSSRTHQVDEGAPRVPKLWQRKRECEQTTRVPR